MALKIVIYLSALFVLLLILVYIYLTLQKLVALGYKKKKEKWLIKNVDNIEKYLFSGAGAELILPVEKYQFEVLEEFFSDYLSNFKLDASNNPLTTFVNRHMIARYEKNLFDKSWSIRINTLHYIDFFNIKALVPKLLLLLADKRCSPEESYQIYLLLAKFEYSKLMELIEKGKEMPSFLLNEMLWRLVNNDNFGKYVDKFHDFPLSWQLSLLDVLRDKNIRSIKLQILLEDLIEGKNHELRIRALKTISGLGYLSNPELILSLGERLLKDEERQASGSVTERLMVARLMGAIKVDSFIPYLEMLIADPSYPVRAEAAKSIRKYKRGMQLLIDIAANHSDSFARSIAKEWLERSIDYE